MDSFLIDSFEDEESNPFLLSTPNLSASLMPISRRSCVNSKVRWLMFKSLQPLLTTNEEVVAAQWILCHCHKQLPYDRNWWSRMERQNGELATSNPEVSRQVESLNFTLHLYVKQLVNATSAVRKYIDGIDPVTNKLRKRDWNASASLSEWISGDRGLLIKKLANNDADVRDIRQYLPDCLCEDNLKEALHNGGILIYTDQFPSTRVKRVVYSAAESDQPPKLTSAPRLNLVRPGAADTRMLDITLMDGSVLPVRRSRCSLGIPPGFVSDPVVVPKICVYDFSNGLNLYIFYRGHKMGKRKRPRFHVAEQHHLAHAAKNFGINYSELGDDESDEEPHTVKKRLRINAGPDPSDQSLSQLLPGVAVPISLKALATTNELDQTTNGNRDRDSLYPHVRENAGVSSILKSETRDKEPIKVGLSPHVDAREKLKGRNWDRTQTCALTSIPIESVFGGSDNSTYLLSATLVVEISPVSRIKLDSMLDNETNGKPLLDSWEPKSPLSSHVSDRILRQSTLLRSGRISSTSTAASTPLDRRGPRAASWDGVKAGQSYGSLGEAACREAITRALTEPVSSGLTDMRGGEGMRQDEQLDGLQIQQQNQQSHIAKRQLIRSCDNSVGETNSSTPKTTNSSAASLNTTASTEPSQPSGPKIDIQEVPLSRVAVSLSSVTLLAMNTETA